MEQRVLGRTGRQVSVVGLGTWQLGADWGHLSRDDALAVLRAAADAGVRFFARPTFTATAAANSSSVSSSASAATPGRPSRSRPR